MMEIVRDGEKNSEIPHAMFLPLSDGMVFLKIKLT